VARVVTDLEAIARGRVELTYFYFYFLVQYDTSNCTIVGYQLLSYALHFKACSQDICSVVAVS